MLLLGSWAARRYTRFRPFAVLLTRLQRFSPEARSRGEKHVFRAVYGTLNRLLRGTDVGFLNYGYAPLGDVDPLDLPAGSEPDRFAVQLYDKVAGATGLDGLDVLEVGCGRGGGAAFVFERHRPASMIGLDLADGAIAFCRRQHARPGLSFVAGDAELLPFSAASFDAVLNVESSHCYPDMHRFLAEVARVLRPGGVFLFADIRRTWSADNGRDATIADLERLRAQIAAAGFVVAEEEDITGNVVRALELDSARRRELIERTTPRLIRAQVLDFSGVEGSGPYRALAARELTYVRMVLRRAQDVVESAA